MINNNINIHYLLNRVLFYDESNFNESIMNIYNIIMEKEKGIDLLLYLMMLLASVGLGFFVYQFFKCRKNRNQLDIFEDDEINKI